MAGILRSPGFKAGVDIEDRFVDYVVKDPTCVLLERGAVGETCVLLLALLGRYDLIQKFIDGILASK
jgi:hypothetical protein